jgi:hypothetical protein
MAISISPDTESAVTKNTVLGSHKPDYLWEGLF